MRVTMKIFVIPQSRGHVLRVADGAEQHRRHPDTFWVPSAGDLAGVVPGDFVKAIFFEPGGMGERMWVRVDEVRGGMVAGVLASQPCVTYPDALELGARVQFPMEAVIDIRLAASGG